MKRVLIVSPHFAPAAAPDGQRTRMMLPFLRESGWEPSVLAVSPDRVDCPVDPLLCETFPKDLELFYSSAFPTGFSKLFGVSTLGWRCWPFLASLGSSILRNEQFDLIYFSTTQFLVLSLARRWQRQFHLPYVIDLQDPWLKDHNQNRAKRDQPGTGGNIKNLLVQRLAERNEPRVLLNSSGISVVSPVYKDILLRRYPQYPGRRIAVIPFGSLADDWQVLDRSGVRQSVFSTSSQKINLVYVGRGGQDLLPAVEVLCQGLNSGREINPDLFSRIRVFLVGTSYAPKGQQRKSFSELISKYKLEDCVTEVAGRLSYFQALKCLKDASVLMVFGSEDSAYSPSKLYPYITAGKPVFVFAQKGSVLESCALNLGVSHIYSFEPNMDVDSHSVWQDLSKTFSESVKPLKSAVLESIGARAMTVQLAQLFDQALGDFHGS